MLPPTVFEVGLATTIQTRVCTACEGKGQNPVRIITMQDDGEKLGDSLCPICGGTGKVPTGSKA